MIRKSLSLALPLFLLTAVAHADVTVSKPWVRGTVAQQKVTGAFMRLKASRDMRLVNVSSPVAGLVEIHEMAMDNDVMRMRPIKALALPAGKPVDLAPGGYHIMLMNLKAPVREGETVPLKLELEDATGNHETVDVQAAVKALGGMGPMHGH